MVRFFCSALKIKDNKILIDDKNQLHHARDVLRLKKGEPVTIIDEKGNKYRCIIEELKSKMVFLIKERHLPLFRKEGIRITVACAIPKKAKMDDIVDKLTQLGVERIIPLETERVIVKLDKSKGALRRVRWEKIALSASQQSQRNIIPIIEPIKGIKEVLTESRDFDLKLIPTLVGKPDSFKKIINILKPRNILILIGPEGDFTESEVDLAKKSGCIPVSLGDLVLRLDTAAIAIVSFIRLNENR
jgi:16S rRNA (uracil1498-N3)-methyltransferase